MYSILFYLSISYYIKTTCTCNDIGYSDVLLVCETDQSDAKLINTSCSLRSVKLLTSDVKTVTMVIALLV